MKLLVFSALILFSVLPLGLAFASITGLGLLAGSPAWVALTGATLLLVLPILALGGPGKLTAGALCTATATWPVVVLVGLSGWFPGDREPELTRGMELLATPLPPSQATRLTDAAPPLARQLAHLDLPRGMDSGFVLPSLEEAREAARRAAGQVAPQAQAIIDALPSVPARLPAIDEIVLPYRATGEVVKIPILFDGPEFSEELWLVFDTGASITTLSRSAVRALGIDVPRNAPVRRLETANGMIEVPIILIGQLWLGDRSIQGVSVAVCDSCAVDGTAGLLGLNVTEQFIIQVDGDREELSLKGRQSANRRADVEPWIQLESRAMRWPDGRIELELSGRNSSGRRIAELGIEVGCGSERFLVSLDAVGPDFETQASLPPGQTCDAYRVQVGEASW